MSNLDKVIETIKFNDSGLVPAIAQDSKTKEVLMLAWMNEEALRESIKTQQMCYFSLSRNKLWRNGSASGRTQKIKEMMIDCDSDSILALIDQDNISNIASNLNYPCKTVDNDNNIKVNKDIVSQQ